jgi:hypothetical protein
LEDKLYDRFNGKESKTINKKNLHIWNIEEVYVFSEMSSFTVRELLEI